MWNSWISEYIVDIVENIAESQETEKAKNQERNYQENKRNSFGYKYNKI